MKIKAYKGFDKNMQCRGFQFEEGKEYEEKEASLCKKGFHVCENPLDTFRYYEPGKGSTYHEVELDATEETEADSKRCGTRIKIGAKLSVLDICKAHFQYVKERTTDKKQGKDEDSLAARNRSSLAAQDRSSLAAQDCSSLAAQDWSSLAARNRSSLSARNCSSLAAQDWSSLAAGKNSVIAAFNSKAKGDLGTLIVLSTREFNGTKWVITGFSAGIVDGEKIKANTWYEVKNGEFVEVKE